MGTVLVTDVTTADSIDLMTQLVAGGHVVARCFPLSDRETSCSYVVTGHCPVDREDIAVAVDVRGEVRGDLTDREQGLVCAVRAGIPAVVATNAGMDNPLWESTMTVAVADAEIAVVAALGTVPTARLARAAARELARVLTSSGHDASDAAVDVMVTGRTLDLWVRLTARPPLAVRCAVRAAAERVGRQQWPPLHVGSIGYDVRGERDA